MDYEKKYKEALERAKDFHSRLNEQLKKEMENIFPELNSEDERINKKIIATIHLYYGEPLEDEAKEMIAYLEKQGEHAKFIEAIQVGDQVTKNEDGVLVNLSQLKRVAKNQGEQQPADKVEPKFKAGDWVVVNDGRIGRISECTKDFADVDFEFSRLSTRVNNIRFWTIQDAKDGDVLVSKSPCGLGTWYCIFKSLDDDDSMTVYCYLARNGRFETKKELCFNKNPYNTIPATKEQRDTLLKAMTDAGYTFDFEKKELKKIEQKPAEEYNITGIGSKNAQGKLGEMIKNLKPINEVLEQKPAWSEEQLDSITAAINNLEYLKNNYVYHPMGLEPAITFLKSLKDRVQPQPKQEWSEQDKNMLQSILDEYKSMPIEKRNWLKSLKEKCTWKPSDEQMDVLLSEVTAWTKGCPKQIVLESLYQDLKKLREE